MSEYPTDQASRVASADLARRLDGEFPAVNEQAESSDSTVVPLSLAQAVHSRRAEFTSPKNARIKIGTWNVAAFKETDKDIGAWFIGDHGVPAGMASLSLNGKGSTQSVASEEEPNTPDNEHVERHQTRYTSSNPAALQPVGSNNTSDLVDLYVLGLQEIVDINSAVEALRPFSDASTSKKYKDAIEAWLPSGFRLVSEQQLVGMLLLVYASQDIAPQIRSVSTVNVGTGLMGYMGNKGGVISKLVLGEATTLVFINSHLSAGVGKSELERRNWDAAQIVIRAHFDSPEDFSDSDKKSGERIGSEDYAFWFGDLNYRVQGIPANDVRRILSLHARDEYRIERSSEPSFSEPKTSSEQGAGNYDEPASSSHPSEYAVPLGSDPASLQATLDSLLLHDELRQQQEAGKAFHDGWKEGLITFLPTYKYDVGSVDTFDSGEKKRGPSWCDRILYRTRKGRHLYENQARLQQETQQKDKELKARGIDSAAEDENTMFEYDPETDGDEDYEIDSVESDASQGTSTDLLDTEDNTIRVERYAAHQGVLSSDHKPLDCTFTITYDAVDSDLKAKVHEQVAREIDRAENEGRPVLTLVVERNLRDEGSDGVDFGPVRYDDRKTSSVTIANTGQVSAQFGFVGLPLEPQSDMPQNPSPTWLSMNPLDPSNDSGVDSASTSSNANESDPDWAADLAKTFTLLPGETMSIEIISHVKAQALVRSLNDGEDLENVLVLRVKGGKDHFLPVKGSWQNSIHGRTIERLIRIPEGGVRALQDVGRDSSVQRSQPETAPVVWSAPREIFRLTEVIENLVERIAAEWSMLGQCADGMKPPLVTCAGWPFVEECWTLSKEVRRNLRVDVNEALDTDRSFDSILSSKLPPLHRLEVFSEALLDFLANLQDGVIPSWVWTILESEFFARSKTRNKLSTDEKKGAALEILAASPSHSISFVLLTSMLARVSQEITSAAQSVPPSTSSAAELPESPRVKLKRKSLDNDRSTAIKQLIHKNLAAVFADVLVRTKETSPRIHDQKREFVEIFLESTA